MNKPQGYDETEAKENGNFPKVEAGGYIAKIVNAEEKLSGNGNNMFVLSLDIAEGEHAGFYRQFSERMGKEIYLLLFQLTDGEHTPYFKGLIKAIEESNNGFKFNFDEKTLVGKKIGVNLREEEYEKDGTVKTSLKVAYHCSTDSVRKGLPVLAVKKLKTATTANQTTAAHLPNPQNNDDLPF